MAVLNGLFAGVVFVGLFIAGISTGDTTKQRFWLVTSALSFVLYAFTNFMLLLR